MVLDAEKSDMSFLLNEGSSRAAYSQYVQSGCVDRLPEDQLSLHIADDVTLYFGNQWPSFFNTV